tara:strand:+ start:53 stop:268 length:216 start_codon:yes stop_codon:yes gene_type:complete
MGNFDDVAYKGLNLTTMIVIVLVILKVHGLTSLSWLWVFSPWWIAPFAFFIIIFIAIVILFFVDTKNKKNK